MKKFLAIVVVFLTIDASYQRSYYDRESSESNDEYSNISEENEEYDIDDIQSLDVNQDLELISLLVDKLILNSLRDQRKLLTTERELKTHHHPFHHTKKHHRHHKRHNKETSNSDMIPYPRAG